ncbi:serine/threonine-protein phosphatase [Pimelobacter simplex]|uniref:Protein serine/threonine phosphatase PrpC, regulation of stationary phase n=1 Tax=Nocardioides simplex TaxID=2045 RepID=A0A0A1DGP1_NOCSI|nr:protein phosphatase 2C domain-containing protein [Pimelobacter simplex]AIY16454.1 Protein serine/threonine phosphatase PrpC, regulation of stationary phase [Pimelobacter simplex]MCG8152857.1 serine/threonine-protein phosphatase [Pimelobacter simplex]GEB11827.1 serine/threonine protein phosphatase [Pimelobacter simplex]SFN02279.1 protein phosphatase [Pimelobacter simplex]
MTHVELHHGAATDVGLVRQANEDAYLATPPVFVVADGMGGHDRGDIASAFVVEEFARLAEGRYDLERGTAVVDATLQAVQDRLLAYDAEQRAAGAGDTFAAGTTAVIALLVESPDGPRWLLANVGDSRIYRFSEGELEQVSVDHSVVQELVDAGRLTPAAAAVHPSRNVVTRALGGAAMPSSVSGAADYFLLPLSAVERLVLCSDGVSGMIDDPSIAEILARHDDPRDAADALVAAAVAAGGHDNATAVVVDVVGLAHEDPYDSAAQRMSLEQKLGALP